jgi:hypothetical protein
MQQEKTTKTKTKVCRGNQTRLACWAHHSCTLARHMAGITKSNTHVQLLLTMISSHPKSCPMLMKTPPRCLHAAVSQAHVAAF